MNADPHTNGGDGGDDTLLLRQSADKKNNNNHTPHHPHRHSLVYLDGTKNGTNKPQ